MSSQYVPPYESSSNNIKVQLDLITQQKMMLKI